MISLLSVGSWYHENGEYEKAIDYFEQAINNIRANNLKGQEPHCLLDMGLALHYKGELELARENLENACELAVKVNSKGIEDYARRYLGFVLIDQGKLELAKTQFTSAEKIATSMGNKVSLASAKIGLGWIEMVNNGAQELILTGIDEAKKLGDTEMILKGQTGLAKLLIEQNMDSDFSLELLNSSKDLAKSSGYKCEDKTISEQLNKHK